MRRPINHRDKLLQRLSAAYSALALYVNGKDCTHSQHVTQGSRSLYGHIAIFLTFPSAWLDLAVIFQISLLRKGTSGASQNWAERSV